MKLNVYTVDEGGVIAFLGGREWDSRDQYWEYWMRLDDTPEFEDVMGWPDARIEWRGNIGLGVAHAS
ncbi:hypothetical protein [Delftia acidovorans]